jgi:uncharacterized Zn finger protein (UPF0148 family)
VAKKQKKCSKCGAVRGGATCPKCGHQHKRGGARDGSGQKKREAPVEVIDGRTITGKDHAQNLIDELNAIDPEIMEHRQLRVSPDPWEIPDDATDEKREELEKLEAQRKLALALKNAADARFQKFSYEVQGWALLWFAARTALETRKYLYDRAKGKAVITVNHVHDKPIEMNHTFSISDRIKRARERVAKSKA